MAEEEVKAEVKTSVVETTEEPFKPGEKVIEVVLKPKPEEEPYWPPGTPFEEIPPEFWERLAPTIAEDKPVIIDVETTGDMPFNSTLICVGALDPAAPDEPMVFQDLDEMKMLENFLAWYRSKGFNKIIGYNVSFDTRFIFAKAMRYRLNAGEFADADISDMMQVMKQVKEAFVYTMNKPGHLYQWVEYLFGEKIEHSLRDILKAWEDKRYADIVDICKKDLQWTYNLWLLVNFTKVKTYG